MRSLWFFLLMASICLEGLGRRYLPGVPSAAFYFAKDVVLVGGYFLFPIPPSVPRTIKLLYRGFGGFWTLALLWTLVECLNPEHQSIPLAILGMRAYWFWFLAPFVVTGFLLDRTNKRRAIQTLLVLTIGVSILAAVQFAAPADSAVNLYSVVDGENLYASEGGMVASTGRARVASTFAFLSGFQDFTILIPTLLLSLGLNTNDKRLRIWALLATLLAAAVVPMSGSRASVILGVGVLLLTTWSAGLFFTIIGRRIMVGALVGVILAGVAFPDAFIGVQSRFDSDETQSRLVDVATVLPPVALLALDYPLGGIGTGMQQNARQSLQVSTKWETELENHRYLVELGVVGFCLIWIVKLGIMVALLRAYRILQRAGRRAAAGAALSYAAVTFFGNLTFDHIWQALFFIGCGFILAETISCLESNPSLAAVNV
jgi:hypothetical protein